MLKKKEEKKRGISKHMKVSKEKDMQWYPVFPISAGVVVMIT
jgi:hypothetical protein